MRMLTYVLSSLLVISLAAVGATAHDSGNSGPSSTQTQMNSEAKTFFDQGQEYSKKRSWDLAVAAYQQAVRAEPKFVEAWNGLGHACRKVKQYDKALDAYKQAIALRPDYANPHEYLARTYVALGDKDAAMREYEIVKRLDAKMAVDLLKAIEANNPDLGDED
ncbi:MAG: tetratricopeptide repeat protein [Bacillati bacterium ANGP1]|uniref:Tetratricopeptide repeat protein n=1 Tax=Candidatus Segetimicrobium genomatis TaxID=2569760 RepID=A0A537J5Y6_9BACT|nr:MAG: tetratricopeptide repeat protein [Terrabacteria group bacterium ANGP1]